MKAVRIIEMQRVGGVYEPTGREILMDEESPLFDILKAQEARTTGAMSVEPPMFEQIKQIVEDANERGSGEGIPE